VPVAILGDSSLNAASVSCASLGFGPSQAAAMTCEIEDVNDDWFDDLVANFQINETGIIIMDTHKIN
jgi:hypothetical protein